MKKLKHCPLCNGTRFHPVRGFDIKPPPEVYARLGLPDTVSWWAVCKTCGFFFQNPRPTTEAILNIYAKGIYRQDREYDEQFFLDRYDRPLGHLDWCGRHVELQQKLRILDIGAGYGGAVRAFRDRGNEAVGIELDGSLIEMAENRYNVDLVQTSIEDTKLEPESFDLIYSSHVHEHFDDFSAINRKLYTLLSPGGHLLCILPTYRLSPHGYRFANVFHNSMFTAVSLHNMFVQAGLAPVRIMYPLHESLPEVWGVATKPAHGMPTAFKNDWWRFVAAELRLAPPVMRFYYRHLFRYAYRLQRDRVF
ncbi:class I SAM-dependent methyltransferase [Pseudodesulfovibrio sp.]|uniref:class I SAM-dependent methyltransferase n=1 Tax=unclassified Pseudodesulfovibrio TaxID=2661612 RepID=UPI003B00B523